MTITASCGHKLQDGEETYSVEYKDVWCDPVTGFQHCTVYAEFCPSCAAELLAKQVAALRAEASAWAEFFDLIHGQTVFANQASKILECIESSRAALAAAL